MEISRSCTLPNHQQPRHHGSYLRPPSSAAKAAAPAVACCRFRTEFSDRGHLQYYAGKDKGAFCAVEKTKKKMKMKMKKKNEKLSKGKSIKSLTTEQKLNLLRSFSDSLASLGAGSELDRQQTDLLSEAAETFLERFKELRVEEEKPQEKLVMAESESSSSSSSESDECRRVKTLAATTTTEPTTATDTCESTAAAMREREGGKEVEVRVCTGNKCKKFGAEALMAEFQSQSSQVVVQPCKCLGKCRSAPNVRVSNRQQEPDWNPLFLGVSLHDVPSILDSFFGGPPTSAAALQP